MVKCERQSIDTRALFVFIGAVPNTAWLAGTIERRRPRLHPDRPGRAVLGWRR